ncbi:hypothetical protein [Niallia taxi]|uniref:hypothetical protein n=1 Tax=Niallia taxi TaxID=2499688 RepID=UPI0015F44BB1|nr:hypothetical protein [Niallia taxi]
MNSFYQQHFESIAKKHVKRTLKQHASFLTLTGARNFIEDITAYQVTIKTKKTRGTGNKLSIKNIIKASTWAFYVRTWNRKDLEQFTNFTSALMGLLRLIFLPIAHLWKASTGLLRITLGGRRFFFGGLEAPTENDVKLALDNGALFFLWNFYNLGGRSIKDFCEKHNRVGIVDPGVFSFMNKPEKAKDFSIKKYAEFIVEHKEYLLGYLNYDWGTWEEMKANYDYLSRKTGIRPIPVWIPEYGFETLDELINEDHPLIAIGRLLKMHKSHQKKLFDKLFEKYPNQNFHALGVSGEWLFRYPFYSADSTSWSRHAREKNQIVTPNGTVKNVFQSANDCIAYCVRTLSELENKYDMDIQLDIFSFTKKMQQEVKRMEKKQESLQFALEL